LYAVPRLAVRRSNFAHCRFKAAKRARQKNLTNKRRRASFFQRFFARVNPLTRRLSAYALACCFVIGLRLGFLSLFFWRTGRKTLEDHVARNRLKTALNIGAAVGKIFKEGVHLRARASLRHTLLVFFFSFRPTKNNCLLKRFQERSGFSALKDHVDHVFLYFKLASRVTISAWRFPNVSHVVFTGNKEHCLSAARPRPAARFFRA
jgi:hypothetical protein